MSGFGYIFQSEAPIMATETQTQRTVGQASRGTVPPGEPCLIVIFGASGDLTKRLLMPAFYNLTCDGLLPDNLR